MQNSAAIDTAPKTDRKKRSYGVGVIQTNGAVAAPNANEPKNCPVISTVSLVSRTILVTTIRIAKNTLPVSAISAGRVNEAAEGRSAITTPAKPTSTAVQRRQPTFSFKSSAENAVT